MMYSQTSIAIEAQNSSNIEVRNLPLHNMYVHTAEDSQASCSNEVDQTNVVAVHVNWATNVSIHDSDMHDIGWMLPGVVFGAFSVYNNQMYNMDHGIALGNSVNTNADGPVLDTTTTSVP